MKKVFEKKKYGAYLCIVFLFVFRMSVYAVDEEESDAMKDIQQQTEEKILEEIDFTEINKNISELFPESKMQFEDLLPVMLSGDLQSIGETFLQYLKDQFFYEFTHNKSNLIHIILLTIVSAVFSNISKAVKSRQISEAGFYLLYILLITLCLNVFKIAVSGIEDSLENVIRFMKIFCPGYFLAMAISSGSSAAIGFNHLVILIILLTEIVFLRFLIPVIHVYIMVQVMNHLFIEEMFGKLSEFLKKFIDWFLKTMLGAVIGINVVQGLLAPAMDQLKRSTITKTVEALPGVGNLFGSAADVVLSTAVLLKNGIGMSGAIILLFLCAIPVVQMMLLTFMYQLAAAVVEPISDKRITGCISSVGDGYELILKVFVTTTLLFLLTIAIASSATS